MNRQFFIALAAVALSLGCASSLAQDQTTRRSTRADFINVDGGNLSSRIDRAVNQFKSSKQGDSLWIAYHFPAREGASFGPFTGMIYYDDGIRLERKDDPANAAVFLLTDAAGSQARFTSVKTLDLSEPYVFEKRPVYWLGNVDAAESLAFLETTMRAGKENKDMARGCLRAIASHDSPRVVPLLKEIGAKDPNVDLQTSAVSNLSRVRTEQGVDALIDLYDNSSVDSIKEEVIRGLARNDHRKAADKLLAIAKNDANPKLRQQAVRRLSQNKGGGMWFN